MIVVVDYPISKVLTILKKYVEDVQTPIVELVEAQTKDPFKILLTTILSARTKDQTTASVLPNLFKKVKKPADLNKLTESQISKLIYPVGFYKTKAKHLKLLPKVLKEEFDNVLPSDVDSLTKLPGVGRKTANLVVAVGFHKPAICVDVHVHRISNRLGYIKTKDPFDTEMTLRKVLDKKYWQTYNSILVAFGQHLCKPVSPHCSICPVKKYCKQVGVKNHR